MSTRENPYLTLNNLKNKPPIESFNKDKSLASLKLEASKKAIIDSLLTNLKNEAF